MILTNTRNETTPNGHTCIYFEYLNEKYPHNYFEWLQEKANKNSSIVIIIINKDK